MIILGLILLIAATCWISPLYYPGGILLVVGIILMVLGSTGRAVGCRRHYF